MLQKRCLRDATSPGVERLVAGVVVIGLILWGTSMLATPEEPGREEGAPPASRDRGGPASLPPRDAEGEDDEPDDEEEGDDEDERRPAREERSGKSEERGGKKKKGR